MISPLPAFARGISTNLLVREIQALVACRQTCRGKIERNVGETFSMHYSSTDQWGKGTTHESQIWTGSTFQCRRCFCCLDQRTESDQRLAEMQARIWHYKYQYTYCSSIDKSRKEKRCLVGGPETRHKGPNSLGTRVHVEMTSRMFQQETLQDFWRHRAIEGWGSLATR